MSDRDETQPLTPAGAARPDWKWLAALGALMIIGGFLALVNPFAASLTATVIAGTTFLFAGAIQLWMAVFDMHGTRSRIGAGVFGALLILLSVALLANPVAGILSLTILVGAFFLAMGVTRIVIALKMRDRRGYLWLLGGGILSALLGVLTLLAVPAGALGLLGVFLAVDLLASGAGALALALAIRSDG